MNIRTVILITDPLLCILNSIYVIQNFFGKHHDTELDTNPSRTLALSTGDSSFDHFTYGHCYHYAVHHNRFWFFVCLCTMEFIDISTVSSEIEYTRWNTNTWNWRTDWKKFTEIPLHGNTFSRKYLFMEIPSRPRTSTSTNTIHKNYVI